uniref:Uncharacterized protein n=1 Tax=Setaria viridis TaxID=4556 RepID=A0A4U6UEF4_SETVI|nr:hypothetical protein SEVIR_5G081866v2 [Setaria viridis]
MAVRIFFRLILMAVDQWNSSCRTFGQGMVKEILAYVSRFLHQIPASMVQ